MLAAQPPFSGDRKSHRRPLRPQNQSTATIDLGQLKPYKEISVLDISNKENVPPFYSAPVEESEISDPSLAEELNAVREKLIRLRIEEDRNEEVLRERGLMLDMEMKEILNRGEMQKELELEVDRLYRLKEIKLACMRTSRFRSLRDREEDKKIKQDQLNKASILHSPLFSSFQFKGGRVGIQKVKLLEQISSVLGNLASFIILLACYYSSLFKDE